MLRNPRTSSNNCVIHAPSRSRVFPGFSRRFPEFADFSKIFPETTQPRLVPTTLVSLWFPRPFLTAGLFGIFKKTLLPTLGAAVKRQCPTRFFFWKSGCTLCNFSQRNTFQIPKMSTGWGPPVMFVGLQPNLNVVISIIHTIVIIATCTNLANHGAPSCKDDFGTGFGTNCWVPY